MSSHPVNSIHEKKNNFVNPMAQILAFRRYFKDVLKIRTFIDIQSLWNNKRQFLCQQKDRKYFKSKPVARYNWRLFLKVDYF